MRYEKYKLSHLFTSQNGDTDIKKEHITGHGERVITSGVDQCGVLGKTDMPAKIISENTITVDMFGNAYFRPFPYKMVTHARVFSLEPIRFDMSQEVGLYIVSQLKWLPKAFSYSNMCSFAKIKDLSITLPTHDIMDKSSPYSEEGYIPDWSYMQERIAELEQERIAELEQYLIATGLNDYELTDEDKAVLALSRKTASDKTGDYADAGGKREEEFALNSLFEICTTRGTDKNKIELVTDGSCDFIGRTRVNNGIQGTLCPLNYPPNKANTFSLIQVGESSALWRDRPWYASQNLFCLTPKDNNIQKQYLYFESVINKEMSRYGTDYNSYPTLKSLNDTHIVLPIQTDSAGSPVIDPNFTYHPAGYIPDWDYMEKYIRAVEKLVIADVVKWKDEEIIRMKEIVDKGA